MRRLPAVAAPLLAAIVQCTAAALALGRPDLEAATSFLGGDLTAAGAIAASEVMVWLVVAAVVGWVLIAVGLQLARRVDVVGPLGQSWELAALVAGLVVLAAGGMHHYAGAAPELHGGSVQEARSLAGG